jgi:hypothetical protein
VTGAIRRCNACGEVLTAEGHYVPPSMGEDGFFLCQRESVPAAAPSLPAGAGEPNEPQQALTYGVAPSVEMFARQFLTPTPCDECGEMVCRCVGSPRWKDELIAGLRSTLEERDQRIGELTAEVEEWKADATQRPIFAAICERRGLPRPVFEHRFAPPRRWAFDYAFIDAKVALEVEGGLWVRGAHMRGKHALSDMAKYNRAVELGWKVVRCTPQTLCSSVTLDLLRHLIP